jgi:hypothetical protein
MSPAMDQISKLASGHRISTVFNGQIYEVLDEYYNSYLIPNKVSPIPALKYTTDPLKTPTIALF